MVGTGIFGDLHDVVVAAIEAIREGAAMAGAVVIVVLAADLDEHRRRSDAAVASRTRQGRQAGNHRVGPVAHRVVGNVGGEVEPLPKLVA